MRPPERFLRHMAELFNEQGMQEEWAAFVASFDEPPARAYRFNGLKLPDQASFVDLEKELLQEQGLNSASAGLVPWSRDGRYIPEALQPGKSLAARAGLFYIQEASAMLPAELLDCRPGLKVLDLCAAPGGKSARLAARMGGDGLLWSNDISADRAKVLLRNLEQLGVRNVVVTVAEPGALAAALPQYFDRILLDAPCSGEGMFRRDPQAAASWERYGGEELIAIQADLLEQAAHLLSPQGELLYSTCTFNRKENEEQIGRFLLCHSEFSLLSAQERLPINDFGLDGETELSFSGGAFAAAQQPSAGLCLPRLLQEELSAKRPDLPQNVLQDALRIWPQRLKADGHFACLLKKNAAATELSPNAVPRAGARVSVKRKTALDRQGREAQVPDTATARAAFLQMAADFMTPAALKVLAALPGERWRMEGCRLHLLPELSLPLDLPAVKYLKTGLFLAEFRCFSRGFKLQPTHSFLLSLSADELATGLCCAASDSRIKAYLRGETLLPDVECGALALVSEGGFVPFIWESWPLGWLKYEGGRLKNLYPPGWRQR